MNFNSYLLGGAALLALTVVTSQAMAAPEIDFTRCYPDLFGFVNCAPAGVESDAGGSPAREATAPAAATSPPSSGHPGGGKEHCDHDRGDKDHGEGHEGDHDHGHNGHEGGHGQH